MPKSTVLQRAQSTFVSIDYASVSSGVDAALTENISVYKSLPNILKSSIRRFIYQVAIKKNAVLSEIISPSHPLTTEADYVRYISKNVLDLSITYSGESRSDVIPKKGSFLVVANHPTGLLDAFALFNAIADFRTDGHALLNQLFTPFLKTWDTLIPVDIFRLNKISTIKKIKKIVTSEGYLLLFPSGKIARKEKGVLREAPWNIGCLKIAKMYQIPILPCHIRAKNTSLFHAISAINRPLALIQNLRDLNRSYGKSYTFEFGSPIMVSDETHAVRQLEHFYTDAHVQLHTETR